MAALRPFMSGGLRLPAQLLRLPRTKTQISRGTGGGGGKGGSGGGGGGGQGGGSSRGNNPWGTYLRFLETAPVTTKASTAALLNALGDLIAQKYVEQSSAVDWKRTGMFTFLGLVLVGPALHFWYGTLGRIVSATGNAGALQRLGLDQLLFAPFFIGTFFTCLLTLEGKTSQIKPKLQHDLLPAVIANWKLWIPFQFINFRLVPPPLQVGFSNIIALAWNTYLSWASHNSAASSGSDKFKVGGKDSAF